MKSKSFKSLNCKICGEKVDKVDDKATAVTCWRCTSRNLNSRTSAAEEQDQA